MSLIFTYFSARRVFTGTLFLSLALTGCGTKTSKGDNKTPETDKFSSPVTTTDSSSPKMTPQSAQAIEEPSCFGSNETTAIHRATISSLENGVTKSVVEELNATSAGSLQSDFIEKTSFGLSASLQCSRTSSGEQCGNSLHILRESGSVKICREDASYSPTSIENIAVTSFAHVNHLFQFYNTIRDPSTEAELAKIQLLLMPSLTEVFADDSREKTDNVSYYPSLRKAPTIVVFPKGTLGNSLWQESNLWESAWIMGHEASHHIFRTLVTAASKTTNQSSLSLLESGSTETEETTVSPFMPSVVESMNEGFADLFSYLSLGADSKYTRGFPCFEKTRDIGSLVFGDGSTKSLTVERLSQFLSPYVAANSPCAINNHDSHIIGAIVAYTLNQVFHHAQGVKDAADPHKEAGKLALKWLLLMPSAPTNTSSGRLITRDLLESGLKVSAIDGHTLTAEQCNDVSRGFPVFAAYWFNASSPRFICQ